MLHRGSPVSARPAPRLHECFGGAPSPDPTRWVYDAQGIELFRACDRCLSEKLSRYRPEIVEGYDQGDVDEPIDPED